MYDNRKVAVIVAAAGKGTRLGGPVPKQFLEIGGEPVLVKTLKVFESMQEVDDVFVVTNEEYVQHCEKLAADYGICKVNAVVKGGAERQDSVYNALKAVSQLAHETDIVLIHDGARPFVTKEVVLGVIRGAAEASAAVACVPMKDSLRQIASSDGKTAGVGRSAGDAAGSRSVDRSAFCAVQTPQGFVLKNIIEAYEKAYADGYYGTDDAVLAERAGFDVIITDGDYANIKITTREDMPMEFRVGTGFDVHKFADERDLILGGVKIPYEQGLAGHSDADVLIHALMDALLGAAALGDIGRHFPDTDEKYRGISSMLLLEEVAELLAANGYTVGNVDVTVIAQAPKISPHVETMRDNISKVLKLEKSRINIKGTTTEKLGFTGRKEGIACEAVCSLYR